MEQGKKYTVFSVRKTEKGNTVWVKAGTASVNKDGSTNIYLDVLPLDGKLHIREDAPKQSNEENEREDGTPD